MKDNSSDTRDTDTRHTDTRATTRKVLVVGATRGLGLAVV